MMEIPIFIINGFLDSGKTTFIVDAIEKDGFAKKGRTLVIQCEDGEIEIAQDFANKYNTTLIKVDEQIDLTAEYLSELATRYLPDRVILEMNCPIIFIFYPNSSNNFNRISGLGTLFYKRNRIF